VKENLPLLLQTARLLTRLFPKIHFAIGLPEDWRTEWVKPLLKRYGDDLPLTLLFGQSRLLLKACDVAVLVAGTITLEAACLGIPSVVVFWMGLLNRLQAHWLRWQGVNVLKFAPFALPNRILGEIVMQEFIGWSATPERIADEVADLLRSHDRREEMRQRLLRVWDKIGEPCVATRIAHFLVSWVEEKRA
jgi:lipid-A-disaccharide synthase